MFFDFLDMYQEHDTDLPMIGDRAFIAIDTHTQEELGIMQPTHKHEGSFSTSINIRVSGRRVIVSGNPSRVNRLDNVIGYSDLDQCVNVYNHILESYGLPPFTKATKKWQLIDDKGNPRVITNGATITRIDVTTNVQVGCGNEDCFIKALSTLRYRNSVPRLLGNGKTVDWLTKKGKGSTLIYPGVYNKANEIELNSFTKIKNKFGKDSQEFQYLKDVRDMCAAAGIVRFEQKLRSAYLRRMGLQHYGYVDMSIVRHVHQDFLDIKKKLVVENMSLESITQKLIERGICDNTRAANTTTLYAIRWMHGEVFDLNKRQVQQHRARLNQIGIEISRPCDLTKFSLVSVKESQTVNVSNFVPPTWYKQPTLTLKVA